MNTSVHPTVYARHSLLALQHPQARQGFIWRQFKLKEPILKTAVSTSLSHEHAQLAKWQLWGGMPWTSSQALRRSRCRSATYRVIQESVNRWVSQVSCRQAHLELGRRLGRGLRPDHMDHLSTSVQGLSCYLQSH